MKRSQCFFLASAWWSSRSFGWLFGHQVTRAVHAIRVCTRDTIPTPATTQFRSRKNRGLLVHVGRIFSWERRIPVRTNRYYWYWRRALRNTSEEHLQYTSMYSVQCIRSSRLVGSRSLNSKTWRRNKFKRKRSVYILVNAYVRTMYWSTKVGITFYVLSLFRSATVNRSLYSYYGVYAYGYIARTVPRKYPTRGSCLTRLV